VNKPVPETALSFTRELPLTQAAVAFASERHAGQTRVGDKAPFVVHPLEAASLLERSAYPDEVVAAAALHDVLEDTDTERWELEDRFGAEVAELVQLVSDDPSIAGVEARRDDVRRRVRDSGGEASAVYAADKVSKIREMRFLIFEGMDESEVEVKLRHYEKGLAMLDQTMPGSRIVELLRFEIEALRQLPPARSG
jgi:guanosine-3',5'-bis(diphosphate) 3'-pyrophosphohydrolase